MNREVYLPSLPPWRQGLPPWLESQLEPWFVLPTDTQGRRFFLDKLQETSDLKRLGTAIISDLCVYVVRHHADKNAEGHMAGPPYIKESPHAGLGRYLGSCAG